jgi:hypothetical protein
MDKASLVISVGSLLTARPATGSLRGRPRSGVIFAESLFGTVMP